MSRVVVLVVVLILAAVGLFFAFGRKQASKLAQAPLTSIQRADAQPIGTLKNPYKNFQAVAAEGHRLFEKSQCINCHGENAEGRVCPSLTNNIWIYGSDDDTLFRLITEGTGGIQEQGYRRKEQEKKRAHMMPPFGGIIPNAKDVWKIISWIRTINPASLKTQN